MNATEIAQRAYAGNAAPIRTERGTEYDIIAKVTRKLHDAAKAGPKGKHALAEAIHINRQLWSLLAADALDEDNALPVALRADIISLGEFTRKHSSKVLRGQAGVQALIEINAAVMRGLNRGGSVQ